MPDGLPGTHETMSSRYPSPNLMLDGESILRRLMRTLLFDLQCKVIDQASNGTADYVRQAMQGGAKGQIVKSFMPGKFRVILT